MNALNAIFFTALGSVMEILPRVFPSWFPQTGADQASTRALWLAFMGGVQIAVGVGFIVRAHAVPFIYRILSAAPASVSGALSVPNTRGVVVR
jgi:hypothetical protein